MQINDGLGVVDQVDHFNQFFDIFFDDDHFRSFFKNFINGRGTVSIFHNPAEDIAPVVECFVSEEIPEKATGISDFLFGEVLKMALDEDLVIFRKICCASCACIKVCYNRKLLPSSKEDVSNFQELKQAPMIMKIIFRISIFFGGTCGADHIEQFDPKAFNVDVTSAEIFHKYEGVRNLLFGKMVVTELVSGAHVLSKLKRALQRRSSARRRGW